MTTFLKVMAWLLALTFAVSCAEAVSGWASYQECRELNGTLVRGRWWAWHCVIPHKIEIVKPKGLT